MRSAKHALIAYENTPAFKRLKTLYLLRTYLHNQLGLLYSAYIYMNQYTHWAEMLSGDSFLSRLYITPRHPQLPLPFVSPNSMF